MSRPIVGSASRHPVRAVLLVVLFVSSAGPAASARAYDTSRIEVPLEGLIDARTAASELAAYRDSTAAQQARERARSAYGARSAAGALNVAEEHFPHVMDAPAWSPLQLRQGESVERFVGKRSVLVSSADGELTARESMLPLRVHGELVDLRLRESADGIEPRNPLVPLTLPARAGEELRFSEDGFSLSVDAIGLGEPAQLDDGKAFYGNVAPDIDLIVMPTPTGVQFALQVRSAVAPERVAIAVDLPRGAYLDAYHPGVPDGTVALVRDGELLASISAPVAFDADSAPLRAHFEIQNDRVTVVFPHRSQDVRYPALVDPQVDRWVPNSAAYVDFSAWPYSQQGWFNWERNNRLYIASVAGWWYPNQDYGQFTLQAPRASFITAVNFNNAVHGPSGKYPAGSCVLEGVWAPQRGWWEPGTYYSASGQSGGTPWIGGTGSVVNTNSCSSLWGDSRAHYLSAPTPGNLATFRLIMNGAATRPTSGVAAISDISVALDDSDWPTIGSFSADRTGWIGRGQQVRFTVASSDPGLGMHRTELTGLYAGATTGTVYAPCARISQCPGSMNASFTYQISPDIPDGVRTVKATAYDWLGRAHFVTKKVRVDSTGPQLELGGDVYSRRNASVARAVGDYGLTMSARDGSWSELRAGVESLEVLVDGVRQSYVTQGCVNGSCTMADTWVPNLDRLSDGAHSVKVRAVDIAGNATEKVVQLTIRPGVPTVPTTGGPTIVREPRADGYPAVGEIVSAWPGRWGGQGPINFTYQWQRCSSTATACSDLAGQTNSDYTIVSADLGATLRVIVSASNLIGQSITETVPTEIVVSPAPPFQAPGMLTGGEEEEQGWIVGEQPIFPDLVKETMTPSGSNVRVYSYDSDLGVCIALVNQSEGDITTFCGMEPMGPGSQFSAGVSRLASTQESVVVGLAKQPVDTVKLASGGTQRALALRSLPRAYTSLAGTNPQVFVDVVSGVQPIDLVFEGPPPAGTDAAAQTSSASGSYDTWTDVPEPAQVSPDDFQTPEPGTHPAGSKLREHRGHWRESTGWYANATDGRWIFASTQNHHDDPAPMVSLVIWRNDGRRGVHQVKAARCRECKAVKQEGRPRYPTCRFYDAHEGWGGQESLDGETIEPNLPSHWHNLNGDALPCPPS